MTVETTKVLLAAGFPSDYIQDTIVPNLAALGIEVVRVVPVDYKGEIRDVTAVLFMFQYTSHVNHDKFKGRTKAAGVKFILLERQSSGWPRAFKQAKLDYPGYPINPAPLPVAPVPPKPPAVIVGNGQPLIPPPAKEETEPEEPASGEREATAKTPFHVMLREEREAAGDTQTTLAGVCNASKAMPGHWEAGKPIAPDCVEKLLTLYPRLATAAPRLVARAVARPSLKGQATVHVGGVSVTTYPQRPDVEVQDTCKAPTPPVAVLVPPATSKPRLAPLEGLLRAARALGITGKVVVEVDDAGTRVLVGQDEWTGNYDDAVETARAALESRLDDAEREADRQHEERKARLAAARVLLQGAA